MDLNQALANAFRAARSGNLAGLERELSSLRVLPAESTFGIDERLRAVARSVRCHPAYRDLPAAEAV